MSDEQSPSASRDKKSRSRANRTEISLGDRLQLLGVVIGVISLAVAVYFGYLSLKAPAAVVEVPVTFTPEPSPTVAPPGTVFFEDDFEHGQAKWNAGQIWEIREIGENNHALCAKPTGQNFAQANPRVTEGWGDFTYTVSVWLVKALKNEQAFTLDAHFKLKPETVGYQFQATAPSLVLWRFDPEVRRWQQMSTAETEAPKAGTWYQVTIQIQADGTIRYFTDGVQVMKFQDLDGFVPDGGVRMGVSPGADACFDDVKVSAPE